MAGPNLYGQSVASTAANVLYITDTGLVCTLTNQNGRTVNVFAETDPIVNNGDGTYTFTLGTGDQYNLSIHDIVGVTITPAGQLRILLENGDHYDTPGSIIGPRGTVTIRAFIGVPGTGTEAGPAPTSPPGVFYDVETNSRRLSQPSIDEGWTFIGNDAEAAIAGDEFGVLYFSIGDLEPANVSGEVRVFMINPLPLEGIPIQGPEGPAGTIQIGTVESVDQGNEFITNVGTNANAILNFGLPKGDTGDQGPPGDHGDDAPFILHFYRNGTLTSQFVPPTFTYDVVAGQVDESTITPGWAVFRTPTDASNPVRFQSDSPLINPARFGEQTTIEFTNRSVFPEVSGSGGSNIAVSATAVVDVDTNQRYTAADKVALTSSTTQTIDGDTIFKGDTEFQDNNSQRSANISGSSGDFHLINGDNSGSTDTIYLWGDKDQQRVYYDPTNTSGGAIPTQGLAGKEIVNQDGLSNLVKLTGETSQIVEGSFDVAGGSFDVLQTIAQDDGSTISEQIFRVSGSSGNLTLRGKRNADGGYASGGNIDLPSGATVDGVDVSALASTVAGLGQFDVVRVDSDPQTVPFRSVAWVSGTEAYINDTGVSVSVTTATDFTAAGWLAINYLAANEITAVEIERNNQGQTETEWIAAGGGNTADNFVPDPSFSLTELALANGASLLSNDVYSKVIIATENGDDYHYDLLSFQAKGGRAILQTSNLVNRLAAIDVAIENAGGVLTRNLTYTNSQVSYGLSGGSPTLAFAPANNHQHVKDFVTAMGQPLGSQSITFRGTLVLSVSGTTYTLSPTTGETFTWSYNTGSSSSVVFGGATSTPVAPGSAVSGSFTATARIPFVGVSSTNVDLLSTDANSILNINAIALPEFDSAYDPGSLYDASVPFINDTTLETEDIGVTGIHRIGTEYDLNGHFVFTKANTGHIVSINHLDSGNVEINRDATGGTTGVSVFHEYSTGKLYYQPAGDIDTSALLPANEVVTVGTQTGGGTSLTERFQPNGATAFTIGTLHTAAAGTAPANSLYFRTASGDNTKLTITDFSQLEAGNQIVFDFPDGTPDNSPGGRALTALQNGGTLFISSGTASAEMQVSGIAGNPAVAGGNKRFTISSVTHSFGTVGTAASTSFILSTEAITDFYQDNKLVGPRFTEYHFSNSYNAGDFAWSAGELFQCTASYTAPHNQELPQNQPEHWRAVTHQIEIFDSLQALTDLNATGKPTATVTPGELSLVWQDPTASNNGIYLVQTSDTTNYTAGTTVAKLVTFGGGSGTDVSVKGTGFDDINIVDDATNTTSTRGVTWAITGQGVLSGSVSVAGLGSGGSDARFSGDPQGVDHSDTNVDVAAVIDYTDPATGSLYTIILPSSSSYVFNIGDGVSASDGGATYSIVMLRDVGIVELFIPGHHASEFSTGTSLFVTTTGHKQGAIWTLPTQGAPAFTIDDDVLNNLIQQEASLSEQVQENTTKIAAFDADLVSIAAYHPQDGYLAGTTGDNLDFPDIQTYLNGSAGYALSGAVRVYTDGHFEILSFINIARDPATNAPNVTEVNKFEEQFSTQSIIGFATTSAAFDSAGFPHVLNAQLETAYDNGHGVGLKAQFLNTVYTGRCEVRFIGQLTDAQMADVSFISDFDNSTLNYGNYISYYFDPSNDFWGNIRIADPEVSFVLKEGIFDLHQLHDANTPANAGLPLTITATGIKALLTKKDWASAQFVAGVTSTDGNSIALIQKRIITGNNETQTNIYGEFTSTALVVYANQDRSTTLLTHNYIGT